MLLKIVLLAYSRGVTSSRVIEALCRRDVQFMAASGDMHPPFTTIAGFVSRSVDEIVGLFTELTVFGNIRHNKRLNRFTVPGRHKVNGQWKLYCLVHNIEKLAKAGYGIQAG